MKIGEIYLVKFEGSTRAIGKKCNQPADYTNIYTDQTVDSSFTGITTLTAEQMTGENATTNMTALDFVSRQGVYSGAGGAMMFFHRYGNYEAKNQDMVVDRVANAHPETSVRMERVKQYVISRSNGRVHPNDDGTFTFDGQLVSPPRLYDAESVDRAYYAAAQLAEAIHYGGHIDIVNLNDETYGNQYASDAKLAIAVCDDDVKNRQNFITVDRVGIDAKRAETLLRKKDSPKNDEEKYFMQMIKIVNKVTTN